MAKRTRPLPLERVYISPKSVEQIERMSLLIDRYIGTRRCPECRIVRGILPPYKHKLQGWAKMGQGRRLCRRRPSIKKPGIEWGFVGALRMARKPTLRVWVVETSPFSRDRDNNVVGSFIPFAEPFIFINVATFSKNSPSWSNRFSVRDTLFHEVGHFLDPNDYDGPRESYKRRPQEIVATMTELEYSFIPWMKRRHGEKPSRKTMLAVMWKNWRRHPALRAAYEKFLDELVAEGKVGA